MKIKLFFTFVAVVATIPLTQLQAQKGEELIFHLSDGRMLECTLLSIRDSALVVDPGCNDWELREYNFEGRRKVYAKLSRAVFLIKHNDVDYVQIEPGSHILSRLALGAGIGAGSATFGLLFDDIPGSAVSESDAAIALVLYGGIFGAIVGLISELLFSDDYETVYSRDEHYITVLEKYAIFRNSEPESVKKIR